jgi:hypothetical protein
MVSLKILKPLLLTIIHDSNHSNSLLDEHDINPLHILLLDYLFFQIDSKDEKIMSPPCALPLYLGYNQFPDVDGLSFPTCMLMIDIIKNT